MTSQSPRIYVYKITFEEVPYYYYGVHKEKRFNEYYMGSPITHKWCWDFYTPKKQILQFFDFTDEGWLEAQEVETRLIKPFFNNDKWCLNERCGGKTSLKILRENGKNLAKKIKAEGVGIFGMNSQELSNAGRKGGKITGQKHKENKIGIFGRSEKQKTEDKRKGGYKAKELGVGIFSLSSEDLSASAKKAYANGLGKASPEQRSEWARDRMSKLSPEQRSENGKNGGLKCKELGVGIAMFTREQLSEAGKKGASQKWMCTETGFVSTPGPLTAYQRKRGIDTSKRKRVS